MAEVRIRCGLTYSKEHGTWPLTVGWPFAMMSIDGDLLTFRTGQLVPGRKEWRVNRSKLQGIEPTAFGVRMSAEGFDDRWIVGSLLKERLIRKLRECGIEPSDPIVSGLK